MLDTLTISTPNYTLKPTHRIITVDFRDYAGNIVDSKTIPCKEVPHMTVMFRHCKTKEERYGSNKLFVQVDSLPKALYGNSLMEVVENDVDSAMDFVETGLNETGVTVDIADLYNARVSRVDLCRNLQVTHAIPDYLRVLHNFETSRKSKAEFKSETLTFYNTLEQLAFYNKVAEAKQDKKISLQERTLLQDRPENILRVECRKLKNSIIKRTFGQINFAELFNFNLITSELTKQFDKLQPTNSAQTELDFFANSELLDKLKKVCSSHVFTRFLEVKGTKQFLAEHSYDWQLIKRFLGLHFSRTHTYYLLRKLKESYFLVMGEKERGLLKEIREKITYRQAA